MRSGRPTVWLATKNLHKVQEAKAVLSRYRVPIRQLRVEKTEVQSTDLEKIARYAAEMISEKYPMRLVAVEDSGLFVKSLRGFPGAFSSYVYNTIGPDGLLRLVGSSRDRDAYFQSSVALSVVGQPTRVFTGKVQGRTSPKPRGTAGFGFDPVFIPDGTNSTFAQAGDDVKNRVSHRAMAFLKMTKWYVENWPNRANRALK